MYKLYLGYEEETIDMFSSLCQMEALQESVPLGPGRRLRGRLLEEEGDQFLDEERAEAHPGFGKYRVITVKDKTTVSLKGKEYTEGLANAVVIAYIYDEENNGKPNVFAYAPVSFEKAFTDDFAHRNFKMIFVITLMSIIVLCFVILVFCAYYFVKRKTKTDLVAEMKGPGLQMRNMAYDVCTNPRFDSSTQQSMEEVGGRQKVEVSELSERTNTIDSSSTQERTSEVEKTQKVDSSDDED